MQRSVEQLQRANRLEWGGHLANVVANVASKAIIVEFFTSQINQNNLWLTVALPAAVGLVGYGTRSLLYLKSGTLRRDSSSASSLSDRVSNRLNIVNDITTLPAMVAMASAIPSIFQHIPNIPGSYGFIAEGVAIGAATLYRLGSLRRNIAEARAITRRLN